MSSFDRLEIKNVGQIKDADITFGDLTIFVGPQATGKSIALQILKLIVDNASVQNELTKYGLDWSGKLIDFLNIYLGEGMSSIWQTGKSTIKWNRETIDIESIASKRKGPPKKEEVFFIPAQRVLTLGEGWPRPFTDYRSGDPFAVREFSERLRLLMEREFNKSEGLFPQKKRLKKEYRNLLAANVFSNFGLNVDKQHIQKRFVLKSENTEASLPYMVWSAGQREFVPLLLGLYWLMPSTRSSRRERIKWVILEELEMGLHTKAISVVLLLVLELLYRGYRVCLSSHAPQVLEAIWAINHLKKRQAKPSDLLKIFEAPTTQAMLGLAEEIMKKDFKVFYFNPKLKSTSDISNLDPNSDKTSESGWGGLSEFSFRANDIVSNLPTEE